MAGLVLTYHSANIAGSAYSDNDHVALKTDLELIRALSIPELSLEVAFQKTYLDGFAEPFVVLTCDDGLLMDVQDIDHPEHGYTPGFSSILAEHARLYACQIAMTSFVIASPEARAHLDVHGYRSLGLCGDDWWSGDPGLVIESHSWDHNHPVVPQSVQRDNVRGTFLKIETEHECVLEVEQASDYIETRTGRRPKFFAYPWGEASAYLRREYLPRRGQGIGLLGAVSGEADYWTRSSDPWFIPRMVCGAHWRSREALAKLLLELICYSAARARPVG